MRHQTLRQRPWPAALAAALAASLIGACGGEGPSGPPAEQVGSVEVTSATAGGDLDADGYVVSVAGGAARTIGLNATVTVDGIDEGTRAVELTGAAANCTVAGDNPRSVTVTAGATVATLFEVACVPMSLEGTWLVTSSTGTSYGAGGITTLEFPAGLSGSATFLSQSDANDITTCERHVYAVVAENLVLLDGVYYVASASGSDVLELVDGTDHLTLSKVSGAPPIAACGEASATELATFAEGNASSSRLNAFETRLYFNIEAPDDPIVAYDVATGTFGAPRAYDQSEGGVHRYVVGARSDDLFYGHCACGAVNSLGHFNLGTNASIAVVETDTDLGVASSVRYGLFDGASIMIGGILWSDSDVNTLLTLDADNLGLLSQREILPLAGIADVALLEGDLIALVGSSIVFIGDDGRAEQTVKVGGIATDFPNGLTTIGSMVYVLDEPAPSQSVLYEVAMP